MTQTTSKFYTETQAKQMRKDTQIFLSGTSELAQAHVANAPVSESDPRFFMDREWLAWFADEYPEWTLVSDLIDINDVTNDLYTWMVVIAPTKR